jgi:hypothetical protein
LALLAKFPLAALHGIIPFARSQKDKWQHKKQLSQSGTPPNGAVPLKSRWSASCPSNIFDLIYKGDGGIKIEMAMAQRSPRPSE